MEGYWAIFSRFPLLLKPWRAGVSIAEHFDRIPIWIRLPNLKLDLWAPSNLSKVASFVGMPVTTDACTAARSRIDYARVMVEVPFHGKLPKEIPIQDEEGPVYYQSVMYEWMPMTCELCGWFGHDSSKCKRRKNEQKEEANAPVSKADENEKKKNDEEGQSTESSIKVSEAQQSEAVESGNTEEQFVVVNAKGRGKGKEVSTNQTPVIKQRRMVVSKTPILQNLPAAVKNKKGVENESKNGGRRNMTRPNG